MKDILKSIILTSITTQATLILKNVCSVNGDIKILYKLMRMIHSTFCT